ALLADVLLVGGDGGVGGDEKRVVAELAQGGDQGVVVQAAAANHAGGASGDVRDAHRYSFNRDAERQRSGARGAKPQAIFILIGPPGGGSRKEEPHARPDRDPRRAPDGRRVRQLPRGAVAGDEILNRQRRRPPPEPPPRGPPADVGRETLAG